ncbi:MAG: hypothetical protein K9N48_07345 [Verrucomicrobia bacterium]|nr:hypothetical protein [Verrucomicrobiota bacterium]MCF7708613.1 hypothetical protein [Verrucomicrobiota bacterium]
MVRAARQFFYGAVFDHRKPALDAKSYYRLVRRVVSRSPRQFDPASILIPGFDGLKSFSAAFEETVKSACGGAWRSYFLRSHWRIVWPFSRAHQYRTAENLSASLSKGKLPIVHLIDFPRLNINHGLLLFDEGRDENGRKKFTAYDPNQMTNPAELIFDPKTSTFSFLPCRYWRGGRLNAFEIYYNHIY